MQKYVLYPQACLFPRFVSLMNSEAYDLLQTYFKPVNTKYGSNWFSNAESNGIVKYESKLKELIEWV